MFKVIGYRTLIDFETNAGRRYATAVERFNHKTKKSFVGNRLRRQIYGATSLAGQLDLAGIDSRQSGTNHPSIYLWHELISFGRPKKFRTVRGPAVFIWQAQKDFDCRAG
jgi:hypothetical protein